MKTKLVKAVENRNEQLLANKQLKQIWFVRPTASGISCNIAALRMLGRVKFMRFCHCANSTSTARPNSSCHDGFRAGRRQTRCCGAELEAL